MNHERITIETKSDQPLSIEQLVNPRILPEAGFQSYEMLKNDAVSQKKRFISGEMRNPILSYTKLESLREMDQGILYLHGAIEQVRRVETDEKKADVISTSLEFRAAEMEYVKLLGRLDFVVKEGRPEDEVRELSEEARALGEQLYGTPDKTNLNGALSEVWRQLDAKQLSPSAQRVYSELEKGFAWDDGTYTMPLMRPDESAALPDFNHPSLAWAGEIILEDSADLEAFFNEWWDQKTTEHGTDFVAKPSDIVEAYQGAFGLLDPSAESGVGVFLDPDASDLSWDLSLMAVKVGGNRPPILSAEELFKKFLHEGKGHGGRAINGLKTGNPVLGTGLYTNTVRPDYLTFEEGFLTTTEEAVSGTEPTWNAKSLGHYINIAFASQGSDFRSVFELAWRYRVLMKLQDNEEVTESLLESEKDDAYAAVVRIFRGTPTRMTEQYPACGPLTFNKDLAYLNGRVLAMNHIRELYDNNDRQGLLRLFLAKYDPTIPEQDAIVREAYQDAV